MDGSITFKYMSRITCAPLIRNVFSDAQRQMKGKAKGRANALIIVTFISIRHGMETLILSKDIPLASDSVLQSDPDDSLFSKAGRSLVGYPLHGNRLLLPSLKLLCATKRTILGYFLYHFYQF